jgi:hypothetical protein
MTFFDKPILGLSPPFIKAFIGGLLFAYVLKIAFLDNGCMVIKKSNNTLEKIQ